jgi:type II secretory ATPase GspE/PulE/Tfp pilus assembly ATPase PilB-like protein
MLDVSREEEDHLRTSVLRKIFASLAFSAMTQRYEDVADAHQETFEWIFHEKTAQQLFWTNFSEWLTSGSGIYWVNGKAGSGKSTLLKFIYDDSRTKAHLRSWADMTPLATAAFFFWNSGTVDQNLRQGF